MPPSPHPLPQVTVGRFWGGERQVALQSTKRKEKMGEEEALEMWPEDQGYIARRKGLELWNTLFTCSTTAEAKHILLNWRLNILPLKLWKLCINRGVVVLWWLVYSLTDQKVLGSFSHSGGNFSDRPEMGKPILRKWVPGVSLNKKRKKKIHRGQVLTSLPHML